MSLHIYTVRGVDSEGRECAVTRLTYTPNPNPAKLLPPSLTYTGLHHIEVEFFTVFGFLRQLFWASVLVGLLLSPIVFCLSAVLHG